MPTVTQILTVEVRAVRTHLAAVTQVAAALPQTSKPNGHTSLCGHFRVYSTPHVLPYP